MGMVGHHALPELPASSQLKRLQTSGTPHGVLAAAAEAAALAANSQPVTRRSSSQLGGRGGRAVLQGWCGWGGGAQPVQQDP